jgi:tellurite resistance-related uncharacterized protein
MTIDAPFPKHLVKYGETKIFTNETVPKKLTSLHNTKAGTWGKLCVYKGTLKYIIPGPPHQEKTVSAGEHATIRPIELHRVEMIGAVEFQVEFYREA